MKIRKKRVLFVGPLPPPFSGPELSMKELLTSEALNKEFEIHIVQTNFRKSNKRKGKFDMLMVINFFVFFGRLVSSLFVVNPRLVYYPITPTQLGWLGRDVWTIYLCKMFRCKVLIHLRGSHFLVNYNDFNSVAKYLVKAALNKVDGAIVQANFLHSQFSPFMDESKIYTLYQSIDCRSYSKRDASKKRSFSILVVGHMTKAKGYTDILKVIPSVADIIPDVLFIFAGEKRLGERGVHYCQYSGRKIIYENPLKAEENLLRTEYERNYLHLGVIDGQKKLNHYETADVFLSASYSEGFSRALLEAMAVGLPVLYTPVGAHKEVLSLKNGNQFKPGDIGGMRDAIVEMLTNHKRDELGAHNRIYAESKFALEKISGDFTSIILAII